MKMPSFLQITILALIVLPLMAKDDDIRDQLHELRKDLMDIEHQIRKTTRSFHEEKRKKSVNRDEGFSNAAEIEKLEKELEDLKQKKETLITQMRELTGARKKGKLDREIPEPVLKSGPSRDPDEARRKRRKENREERSEREKAREEKRRTAENERKRRRKGREEL